MSSVDHMLFWPSSNNSLKKAGSLPHTICYTTQEKLEKQLSNLEYLSLQIEGSHAQSKISDTDNHLIYPVFQPFIVVPKIKEKILPRQIKDEIIKLIAYFSSILNAKRKCTAA